MTCAATRLKADNPLVIMRSSNKTLCLIGLALVAALAWSSLSFAQQRLPPLELENPTFENPTLLYDPVQQAVYPGDLSQPVLDDYHANDPTANDRMYTEEDDGRIVPQQFSQISRSKNGFFQKFYLGETYVPRGGDNSLGTNDAEISLSVALPLPNRNNPIVITPGFTTHFLDGPAGTDLPPRLYDAYVAFNWYPRFTPRLGAIVSISPTAFTDFEKWDNNTLRLPGKLLLRYTWAEYERELVLGIIYLDRDDIPWLPAAGLVWTPSPYVCYELIFPRPRVMWMINEQAEHEDWAYICAELGGGSWSIQRVPSYTQDVVTFVDYRAIVGIERRKPGGAGFRIEAGYIFGRSFEYASTGQSFQPDSAVMVRGSLTF
jgi:hypothetical protein